MYILHIETSTKICSIALSQGHNLIGSMDMSDGMNHTALLAPAIEELMKTSGVRITDLAAISVSSGPGSYTGLRVGCSTAKAMAYTLQIPILAIPTLLSLADAAFRRYHEADLVMPMLDARRNEVYTTIYDRTLNELQPVFTLVLDQQNWLDLLPEGRRVIICGDGSVKPELPADQNQVLIDPSIQCKAAHLVEPALKLMLEAHYSNALSFVPFYLKPPNITSPGKLS